MTEYTFDVMRQANFTVVSNLLMENYAKIGLNEQQFSLVLQLESLAQQNNFLPENQLLASRTNFNVSEVGQILQSLIEQKFIEIVQTNDEQNRIQNQYSLSPLYEKLVNYLNEAKPLADVVQDSTTKKNNEIGRAHVWTPVT